MSLSFQVLGGAGRDNAVLVRIDSGQAVSRLLFDCGDGCLDQAPFGETLAIDHLCFSHLHMDHVGGFDAFFRRTFNRPSPANHVWGPARLPGHGVSGPLGGRRRRRTASRPWVVKVVAGKEDVPPGASVPGGTPGELPGEGHHHHG